jgi:response regulator RpfG family c-di-GMP phosphodiesterase
MSRILHVEDEPEWTALTRQALADHRVDCAETYDMALAFLQEHPPYDLALVDLHLVDDNDLLGGEILDLLRARYPTTRRIVITGSPPKGAVRANIFERYGVEEIIIKGALSLPDLRRVVEDALSSGTDEMSQDVKLSRSELRQRLRDWRRDREARNRIRAGLRETNEFLRSAGRVHGQSRLARDELDALETFRQECAALEARLDAIRTMDDARAALAELERLEATYANDTRHR